jgi:hypothetical protein
MRRLVLAALIVGAVAAPVHAQVQVNVGITLPGPPALAVIPGAPVYYAPRAPANVFFYGHQYWLFHGNAWHFGPSWNGPWVVVAPIHVPVPILRVPVRYYHVRPVHWKHWHHDGPPHWEPHWGRDWHEASYERDWREREEWWKHAKHVKHDHDRHHHHGKRGRGKHDDDRHDGGRRGRGDR